MSTASVMPSNHLIPCRPLLLLPSIFSSIKVFSNELVLCIMRPKYWRFSISPSNEYSGLIFFRIDWFDLPAVEGTLKSLLQYHSLKASLLWHSAFFMVQVLYLYRMTGKTVTLTKRTFAGRVMPLLFNTIIQVNCSNPTLCDNREEWDEVGSGREIQKGWDLCTPLADSCWRMAETNTI